MRLLLMLAVTAILAGGCSDRDYGVYSCPAGPRDTLVVYPRAGFRQVEIYADTVATADHDPGMAGMPSLFLGSADGVRSSILVNFDFDQVAGAEFPPEIFTRDNIRSVKLSLTKFTTYSAYEDTLGGDPGPVPTGNPSDLYYLVRELAAPFDPADYVRPPGPGAATLPPILNSDFDMANSADEPFIRLYPEDFLRWFETGGRVGVEIALGPASDPGLVGYASRELDTFQDLPPLSEGTAVPPNLVVEFNDRYLNLLIPAVNDASTFVEVPATEPGTLEVRQGLRSYPVLTFDLPALPEGSCLDHMLLRVDSRERDPRAASPLPWAPLVTADIDLSAGAVREQDLATARSVVFFTTPDTLPPSGFRDANPYVGPWAGHAAVVYPWPEKIDVILGPPDRRDTPNWRTTRTYYSRSTLRGPTEPEGERPALLVIYGRKDD